MMLSSLFGSQGVVGYMPIVLRIADQTSGSLWIDAASRSTTSNDGNAFAPPSPARLLSAGVMGTEAIPGPPELDSLQRGPSPAPLDASHAIDPPAARESSHLFASYRDDWTDVSSQYIGDSQSYTASYADSASSSSSFVERDLPPPLLSQQLAFNNNTTSTHGDLATEDPRQDLYRFVEKLEMSYTPLEVDRAVGGGGAQDAIPAGVGSHGMEEGMEEGMLDARRAGWAGDSSLDGMDGYKTRSYGNDSSIMDGVVPYCRPEGMFDSMLSDSPPSNRLSSSPTTEMHSFASSSVRPPPALQPLDIASAAGPSLHLIAPTPSTTGPGRKKPKGKGTLELESLLGRLVNEEAEGEDNEVSLGSSLSASCTRDVRVRGEARCGQKWRTAPSETSSNWD
jgi:hypothetical protein